MNALIFDVDGVLGDTEPIIAEATIKMYRECYGVETTPEDYAPFIGTGAERYTEGPALARGIDIDLEAAVAARHNNYVALLESGVDISFPGTHELIDAVAAADAWTLAIATSSPGEKAHATLQAARVNTAAFDVKIHGGMVTNKKPHPEIYLKTAEALGLPCDACVVVEDAVTGVVAGKAAGMKVIAVTNTFTAKELAAADLIVDSLEAVGLDTLIGLVGK